MSEKKEIVFLINSPYPRYAGGIETWLYNITLRLHNEYKITIISHFSKEYPVFFENLPTSVKIVHYKTFRSFSIVKKICKSYLVLIDLLLGCHTMAAQLKSIIGDNEQAIVIALDSMFCVRAALLSKTNAQIIASVRGPHGAIYGKQYPLFGKRLIRFEQSMLSIVKKVWANGYDTINDLQQRGIDSSLMKNGIDFHRIRSVFEKEKNLVLPHKTKLLFEIASVGTLLPIKGVYELIFAVRILKENYHIRPRVLFVGKGNQQPFIEYARKNGVLDSVIFVGHKSEPWQEVKGADVLACLSGGSGMSMAALESLGTGIPVIGWDSPVYQQFNIGKQVMTLVREKDANALAEKLAEMYQDYNNFLTIAGNAVALAETYDWKNVCDAFKINIS